MKKISIPTGKIEFLTPTAVDVFREEKISDNKFKVLFSESFLIVEFDKKQDGIGMKITDNLIESDYCFKKLIGYVLLKLLPNIK